MQPGRVQGGGPLRRQAPDALARGIGDGDRRIAQPAEPGAKVRSAHERHARHDGVPPGIGGPDLIEDHLAPRGLGGQRGGDDLAGRLRPLGGGPVRCDEVGLPVPVAEVGDPPPDADDLEERPKEDLQHALDLQLAGEAGRQVVVELQLTQLVLQLRGGFL